MKAKILHMETRWDDVACEDFFTITLEFRTKPDLNFNKDVEVIQDE